MSCAKNPFTGKSTLALVSNSEILPSAFQQYSQFLSENKVVGILLRSAIINYLEKQYLEQAKTTHQAG